jgi:hypothetical protein
MTEQPLKWHDELKQSVLDDDEAREEYKAFKLKLELDETRKKTHLAQDDVV